MTACTSVTARQLLPNCNASTYIVTYSKANTGDTLNMATSTPIKTVRFACATDSGAGAEDPVTFATSIITFSAGTGAGVVFVVGNC